MKFAISTHCLRDKPLDEALSLLTPHTDTVEIMSDGLHHLENADVLTQFSCRWSVHAPTHGVNPASVLEPIRKASAEVTIETFKTAADVDADVIVHPGFYAWEQDREKSLAALSRSFSELRAAAKEYGVRFFVENMGNWGYYYLQTPLDLPLFGDTPFCLDTGHAHLCGSLDAFLDVAVSHIHLHDNTGDTDSHCAAGEGTINFVPVLKKITASGIDRPVIEADTLSACLRSIDYLHSCL